MDADLKAHLRSESLEQDKKAVLSMRLAHIAGSRFFSMMVWAMPWTRSDEFQPSSPSVAFIRPSAMS